MKQKKIKKKIKINPYMVIVGTLLVLYTLSIFITMGWGLLTSFKAYSDFNAGNLFGLPRMEYWDKIAAWLQTVDKKHPNYQLFLGYDNIFGNYSNSISKMTLSNTVDYLTGFNLDVQVLRKVNGSLFGIITNTLFYAVGTAFFAAFAPCIAGYLCSKFDYKFSGIAYAFVVVVITMPIVGNTTAVITLMKRLSLYDTMWGTWIRHFSFANTYFLIFYAFFKGVSNTYAEAAQIDGASYFTIMWKIYIPLSIKMVSTIFLLQLVALYNNYTESLIYMPTYPTLTYAIFKLRSEGTINFKPQIIATSLFLCLPMLIFFVTFKNKLMGNISLGGVKE